MPTFPETPGGSITEEALNLLKGKENPFESLVRPQKGDTRFRDLDVPGLLREPRELLTAIIDSYRVKEYRSASDLKPTRVVIIRGDRGAGKTHLLRAVQYRPDDRSQILVRPAFCGTNLYFEEYLYSELVRVLLEEDEVYTGKPFEDIARALTRRLLQQAVLGLRATDRIFACSPGRWERLRLLLGGGSRLAGRFDRLAHGLADPDVAQQLPALMRSHGLVPEQGMRLIEGHLHKHEKGTDRIVVIRQKLYAAMARLALLDDREALGQFLEGDDLEPSAGPHLRFEIVWRLLHVLVETCALERYPVVFAFDNLERLLSPQGHFDGELTHTFLNNLAQAIDNTRGLLLLLFVEKGLFDNQVTRHIDEFALARLRLGVALEERGLIEMVDLKPPSVEEIDLLIKARIKERLLTGLRGKAELPDRFPFSAAFIRDLAGAGTLNLRLAMQRLRDEFARVVYQRPTPVATPNGPTQTPAPHWQNLLQTTWKDALAAARVALQGSLAASAPALNEGLAALLRRARPLTAGGWTLTRMEPAVSIGQHALYGIATLLEWEKGTGTAPGNGSGERRWIGVSFLLAQGAGMFRDLEEKFELFRKKSYLADGLIILWPRETEVEDLVAALPARTRQVWDKSRYRSLTQLRQPAWDDLCAMLAFPDWLTRLADAAAAPVPAETVREFILARCAAIFPLVQPTAVEQPERKSANAD